jgi:hypothetical protein
MEDAGAHRSCITEPATPPFFLFFVRGRRPRTGGHHAILVACQGGAAGGVTCVSCSCKEGLRGEGRPPATGHPSIHPPIRV